MAVSGGNLQSQPDFGQCGGKWVEGGGDNFQGEGLDFSRTLTPWSLHTGAPCTPLPTHDAHEVRWLDEIFSIWTSIEVCVTPPHFPPDPTERLLSPRTASTPRTQKAADGGQNPLETSEHSEWTKQSQNEIKCRSGNNQLDRSKYIGAGTISN